VSSIDFIISKNLFNEKFLIGSGLRFENKIFAKKIIEIFKKKLDYDKKSIKFVRVKDRPGHDIEYKVNSSKIRRLGWKSKTNIDRDLLKTINYFKAKL
jgi:dTDP-glucose 4,6-dehydratase